MCYLDDDKGLTYKIDPSSFLPTPANGHQYLGGTSCANPRRCPVSHFDPRSHTHFAPFAPLFNTLNSHSIGCYSTSRYTQKLLFASTPSTSQMPLLSLNDHLPRFSLEDMARGNPVYVDYKTSVSHLVEAIETLLTSPRSTMTVEDSKRRL